MRRLTLLLLATFTAWPAPIAAQQVSPYIPLQHWAMPYVEQLIAAGVIADPTPLTRPLRQADLIRALEAADTARAGFAVRATVRRLLAELAMRPGNRFRVEGSAGVGAATNPLRDPLEIGRGVPARPTGPSRAFVSGGAALQAQVGPFVAVTHPSEDTRLRFDPDWYDTRRNGLRIAEAYLDVQGRYGEAFFGTLDRNWGPSGIQGLLLSDNPYSMDHLAIAVGTPGVQLQAIVTQLDTRDTAGSPVNRFIVQHRLYVHPRGRWAFALWEGSVWSGVGRQAEPWYLNLLNLGYIVQGYSGTGNVNSFGGLEVERRGTTTLFGQFMLDDIQYQRQGPADLKPTSYGLTVGAKGRLESRSTSWTVFYTQVANLTYRNEDDLQVPLFHFLPTGRNFSDYDQATAKLGLLAAPQLLLEPELTVLRQGKGDPRLPHPPVSQYPATATLFQGVVERTIRVALGGHWERAGFGVASNGGVHFVHNAGHVTGARDTRWVGTIGITYRIHHEGTLP